MSYLTPTCTDGSGRNRHQQQQQQQQRALLRPHQTEAVEFLLRCCLGDEDQKEEDEDADADADESVFGGAVLAHSMGLGKTVTTIAFLKQLCFRRLLHPESSGAGAGASALRGLILCPKSLISQWVAELRRWWPQCPSGLSADETTETPHFVVRVEVIEVRSSDTREEKRLALERWTTLGCVQPEGSTSMQEGQGRTVPLFCVLVTSYAQFISLTSSSKSSPRNGNSSAASTAQRLKKTQEQDPRLLLTTAPQQQRQQRSAAHVEPWEKPMWWQDLLVSDDKMVQPAAPEASYSLVTTGTCGPGAGAPLLNPGLVDVAVVDEAHILQRSDSVLGDALAALPAPQPTAGTTRSCGKRGGETKKHDSRHCLRIALTGRPVQNNVQEYFTLVRFVLGLDGAQQPQQSPDEAREGFEQHAVAYLRSQDRQRKQHSFSLDLPAPLVKGLIRRCEPLFAQALAMQQLLLEEEDSVVDTDNAHSNNNNNNNNTSSTGEAASASASVRQMTRHLTQMFMPFVHRRDESFLTASLPLRTEYCGALNLTTVQHMVYSQLLRFLSDKQWISYYPLLSVRLLQHVCTHPMLLVRYLHKKRKTEEEKNVNRKRPRISSSGSGEEEAADEMGEWEDEGRGSTLGDGLGGVGAAEELYQAMGPWLERQQLEKADESSVKFKAIRALLSPTGGGGGGSGGGSFLPGDKILLFSHSVEALHLLLSCLEQTALPAWVPSPSLPPPSSASRGTIATGPARHWQKGIHMLLFDGAQTVTQRNATISRWKTDPQAVLLLLSTKAGGVGLNLTEANKVILLDTSWNPAHEAQAICRAYRTGQQRKVTVFRFRCLETVEDALVTYQNKKSELFSMLFDEHNNDICTTGTVGGDLQQQKTAELRTLLQEAVNSVSLSNPPGGLIPDAVTSLVTEAAYAKRLKQTEELCVVLANGVNTCGNSNATGTSTTATRGLPRSRTFPLSRRFQHDHEVLLSLSTSLKGLLAGLQQIYPRQQQAKPSPTAGASDTDTVSFLLSALDAGNETSRGGGGGGGEGGTNSRCAPQQRGGFSTRCEDGSGFGEAEGNRRSWKGLSQEFQRTRRGMTTTGTGASTNNNNGRGRGVEERELDDVFELFAQGYTNSTTGNAPGDGNIGGDSSLDGSPEGETEKSRNNESLFRAVIFFLWTLRRSQRAAGAGVQPQPQQQEERGEEAPDPQLLLAQPRRRMAPPRASAAPPRPPLPLSSTSSSTPPTLITEGDMAQLLESAFQS